MVHADAPATRRPCAERVPQCLDGCQPLSRNNRAVAGPFAESIPVRALNRGLIGMPVSTKACARLCMG